MRLDIVFGTGLLAATLATPPAALAAQPVLTEWEVPYPDSRPRDPYVDTSGTVWFVGQGADYVAAFQPCHRGVSTPYRWILVPARTT